MRKENTFLARMSMMMVSSNALLLLVYPFIVLLALQVSPSVQWAPGSMSLMQVRSFVNPASKLGRAFSLMAVPFDSLMDMDIVVYSLTEESESDSGEPQKYVGAVQEGGTISPLSAWSDEPVFGNSIEFLVDEEDRFPGLEEKHVVIHVLVDQLDLSYGSRQVGGGKGPGNPHGEESELLYYIEEEIVKDIKFPIKPGLEILW